MQDNTNFYDSDDALNLQTRKEYFNEVLSLESGRILSEFWLEYETYGHFNGDNAIIICHALTGNCHAAGRYEGERKSGWWDDMIGANKPIDTNKYFVICVSILGSNGGILGGSSNALSIEPSTSREYRTRFPVLAISDVVRAQMRLFERLGIKKARAIIGGSLGGMQALCFGIEQPHFCDDIMILASTYATQPWAIAFNKIACECIARDPDFKGGYYDKERIKQNGLNGLSIGRMAGHISFLSPHSMSQKFGRNYSSTDGLYELFGRYEIERYMQYNGDNFARKYDPLCYLYVAKMMNNFDCTRHYDSLKNALSLSKARMYLLSFSGDLLFNPSEMKAISDALSELGREHYYCCEASDYGHDAFLVETDTTAKHIKRFLDEQ